MCGILAIYNNTTLSSFIKSLSQLQHRGSESFGIMYKTDSIHLHHQDGKISGLKDNQITLALGHVRYSTTKKNIINTEQPFYNKDHDLYLVHNGNIPNYNDKTNSLTSDTHHILKFITDQLDQKVLFKTVLINLLKTLPGVYSLIIYYQNEFYCCRDRYGIRPLFINKKHFMISSESVSFPDQNSIISVPAGSIVKVSDQITTLYTSPRVTIKDIYCSFEIIYFMNHLSQIDDRTVAEMRYRLGSILAKKEKNPIKKAYVVAMPNTAIPGAEGFASTLKLMYYPYIQKTTFSGRTFILPTNKERIDACKRKFMFDNDRLRDQIIYLVDDSIVRGNTLATVIKQLRDIPVKEIHIRITSPPVISSCYYGIDIPTYEELIANNKTIQEVKDALGADSLDYLTVNELKNALSFRVCTSCFDDKHDQELLDW